MKKLLIIGLVALSITSCVSNKVFNSMKAHAINLESEIASNKVSINELNSRNQKLTDNYTQAIAERDKLNSDYIFLEKQYKKLLSDGSEEASRMLKEIEQTQSQLNDRMQQIEELEQLLKAREEAIMAIRHKVADALLGFEGNGLSITTRDGKVYVSMEDKLLFRSGSFNIDPEGAKAVKELGIVLGQNADINIMVEGHTDNVPYNGKSQLIDNLDLSAKRATTVVRLLLSNKDIDPSRIIASGRGEFMPIDINDNSEARAKNRRTEIILTPKLDELMQLMDK